MSYSETIKVKIKSQDFYDITGKVEDILRKIGVFGGICNIFAVGATGAIIINENEPMLLEDFKKTLDKISSSKEIYQHVENAHSHIRSILVGNNQSIPIKDGKLMLGAWQNILVANFDIEIKEREVVVTIIGDNI